MSSPHSDRVYSQSLLPGSISVVCNNNGRIECKRCDRVLTMGQVAFLTRISPDQAFEAWCINCSLTLSQWALVGAVSLGMKEDAPFGEAYFVVPRDK